ncbi:peptidyl-alpha-hydroxyglycine alpha-amidating lyase 1 isoform X2 [Bemisia tabaci]|uniref:peptidyl-alpha-hydroxyglycine alpha-amidating lyase 1 isoform X2 n=1 Tax=Bemisia tabaci TaxID=7038 RepID=UPI003B286862
MGFHEALLLSCFLIILQLRHTFQTDLDLGDQDVDETEQFLVRQFDSRSNERKVSQRLNEVTNWPGQSVKLGQVAWVSTDTAGFVYVFHRGDRIWNANTFFLNNSYNEMDRGVIQVPTLAIINPDTGALITEWGHNLFFLPHGITVDKQDNVWFTDVALHQVFKYSPMLSKDFKPTLLMTLGVRFEPGNDREHFCKPTSVAVMSNGDFFVADGYCNSRILKFSADGTVISRWGRATISNGSPAPYHFNIPHSLALAEDKNLLYVADRENGRIQVFHASNGTFAFQFSSALMGSRIFSVAYTPAFGGLIYIVNGPEIQYDVPLREYSEIMPMFSQQVLVRGYVATAINCQIIADFHPYQGDFHNPHAVAVTPDASRVYVAELSPYRIWQFVTTTNGTPDVIKTTASSPQTSSTIKSSFVSGMLKQDLSLLNKPSDGTLMAVLVVSAALLFGATLLAAMMIYTRSRNRVYFQNVFIISQNIVFPNFRACDCLRGALLSQMAPQRSWQRRLLSRNPRSTLTFPAWF